MPPSLIQIRALPLSFFSSINILLCLDIPSISIKGGEGLEAFPNQPCQLSYSGGAGVEPSTKYQVPQSRGTQHLKNFYFFKVLVLPLSALPAHQNQFIDGRHLYYYSRLVFDHCSLCALVSGCIIEDTIEGEC
jgi:hypothetical protein